MPQNIQLTYPLVIAALFSLLLTFLFCLNLSRTLKEVKPDNRTIEPSTIWFLLVPLVNVILNFFVVAGISKSLANELQDRDYEVDERPAYRTGMAYSIISCIAIIPSALSLPDNLVFVAGIIGFLQIIFFVQYWMKVSWFRNILKNELEEKEGED